MPMARAISLREFNHHIAEYIHAVEQGKDLILTRRGKPIVQLTKVKKVSLSDAR